MSFPHEYDIDWNNIYYKETTPEVRNLVRNIIDWKLAKQSMYPEDVLNMIVDAGLIPAREIEFILENGMKNPTMPKLPKNHI